MSQLATATVRTKSPAGYQLDGQVGFLLRQVHQRHTGIFAAAFGDEFTPTQWAALAKLADVGECSQNLLGRLIAVDVATIKGVAERLVRRGYISIRPDPSDRRRLILALTDAGRKAYGEFADLAGGVTADTMAPLSAPEQRALLMLLGKLL